jgi:hypothetical protein
MNTTHSNQQVFSGVFSRFRLQRSLLFGMLIIAALIAFEIFNYSTTEFALTDLLGNLNFVGISWATILSIAFCGIDFAGIARLFTPEQGADEPAEVWYLFGAWLLAATMNAMLTWWGVSIAILSHKSLGNAVVAQPVLLKVVPVFVAILVWLIRILIIGTFSVAGDRMLNPVRTAAPRRTTTPALPNNVSRNIPVRPMTPVGSAGFRPAPKTNSSAIDSGYTRPEPTYHPVVMGERPMIQNDGKKQPPLQP